MPTTNNQRGSAFTLVELLATIAILATLAVVSLVYIGNYITWSQKNANASTLATLNTALQEYKTLGGIKFSHSLQGENMQSKIDAVIAALKNGITIYNQKKSFLNKDMHIASTMVYGRSEGKYFSFSGYGISTGGAVTGSFAGTYAAKPPSPPPGGVGTLAHASGTFTFPNITTSTGFFAYKVDSSPVRTSAHGNNVVTTDAGTSVSFWACPSLADNSVSGNVTAISLSAQTAITAIDFRSLMALTSVNLQAATSIVDINLANHTALTTINIGFPWWGGSMQTINLSGCSNWNSGSISFGAYSADQIKSININGCSSIVTPFTGIDEYHGTAFTTLKAANCTSITNLDLRYFNPLNDISISGCTGLTTLNLANTKDSTIDFSSSVNLTSLTASQCSLSSIDLTLFPKLTYLDLSNNPNITSANFTKNTLLNSVNLQGTVGLVSVDLSNHTALTTFYIGQYGWIANTTSINLSGCSNWTTGYIYCAASAMDKIQSINLSGCSSKASPIFNAFNEYHGNAFTTLNITNCAAITSLDLRYFYYLNSLSNSGCNALTSLNIQNCKFTAASLDQIYTNLPSASGTITVTSNPGVSSDTPSIATGKGWTVTGS